MRAVDDRCVWLFAAVERRNFDCMSGHVCKPGDRFVALEPVAQDGKPVFGSIERGVARCLSARMNHGTQYLSSQFTTQLGFWGLAPSYAFVEQPRSSRRAGTV